MNHDLQIFPGDTHVPTLNSAGSIGFVGQREAMSGIERSIVVKMPLLDVILAR